MSTVYEIPKEIRYNDFFNNIFLKNQCQVSFSKIDYAI